ncbi:hypothetical protein BSY18_560 [Blastomonas sp. RAC04]|uniref:hypothetical protein n=1 Tax=Blastomonas sp. RAC04 TaxID=1842535 RepID=UPI00083D90BF|nr:hypothetical protein [Blastomonas sp. RAC04]AOG00614.1 hypothetical protein BSY18_560 [Blastomonas sp. RAC04]
MDAIYKVEVDPVGNIVRHYLAGFFEPMDVEAYIAARNAAHDKLTCGPNEHVTLVDVRDMKIQQQDIVKAFGGVLADSRHRSRKLAFVVALSLARMQLFRATSSRDAQYFTNVDEAEAWLMAVGDEEETPGQNAAEPQARVA